jgi:hypothetical protein
MTMVTLLDSFFHWLGPHRMISDYYLGHGHRKLSFDRPFKSDHSTIVLRLKVNVNDAAKFAVVFLKVFLLQRFGREVGPDLSPGYANLVKDRLVAIHLQ